MLAADGADQFSSEIVGDWILWCTLLPGFATFAFQLYFIKGIPVDNGFMIGADVVLLKLATVEALLFGQMIRRVGFYRSMSPVYFSLRRMRLTPSSAHALP